MEMWKFMADEGCQFADDPRPRLKNQVCFLYRGFVYVHVSARLFRNEEFMRKFFDELKPGWDAFIEKYKYDSPPAQRERQGHRPAHP